MAGIGAGVGCGLWATRGQRRIRIAAIVGGGALGFSSAFVLANVLLQSDAVDRAFLAEEIGSGRLALRIATIAAAYRFFVNARQVSYDLPPQLDDEDDSPYDLEEARARRARIRAYLADRDWRPVRILTRSVVHACALATLWALVILGRRSLEITVLNFLIAFSVDDFLLMASYRLDKKTTPPAWPRLQVALTHWAILALLCTVLFQEFEIWIAACGTVIVLLVVLGSELGSMADRFAANVSVFLAHFPDPDEIEGPDDEI
ncbi:hypothetical protein ACFVHB_04210 [Kitasatospora sp. NPDC127111]|uniref:hypothetical protein n=1 Tax=Kitasatospora sp. NPDC127111 TaxID=3345363 RepID=UPI003643F540